ncbi:primosomal protein N' [Schaalia sp. 19OD2882]|uniref:primosomal protein N' family DNA-binding protein n=1 Tax=Schaalia sp. 19OD2882 TaxID=2794089 RepID=UPI001C1E9C2D|nr:primosomal protein N' [Schaalia sp. 19OD2882]QWW18694.1 primosomal protein N' [Schaalia sp. 19OD2882]
MDVEQEALPGMAAPPRPEVEIAHVLVDVDLPHLDRPLDYVVPDELADRAHIGHSVEVRLAGRTHAGWILGRSRGRPEIALQPIRRVTSTAPVLDRTLVALARMVADRHVATMSQVLSLAVPPRHARTEKAVLAEEPAPMPLAPTPVAEDDRVAWAHWSGGEALVAHLHAGESPRAVWGALAPTRERQLRALVSATLASGRACLVIEATLERARATAQMLDASLGVPVRLQSGELEARQRHRIHLEGLLGRLHVVVGTRSAVWTPMPDLGLIVVWDDGDDRLREVRHPRTDALEVAILRCHQQRCALVTGGWSRSVRAQALVRSGWAVSVDPDLATRRALAPVVDVQDEADLEREGPAGASRVPPQAMRLLRHALDTGPVLVHVPYAGYVPVVSCARCRRRARCTHCAGALASTAPERISCRLCGADASSWRCDQCHGTELVQGRVGSQRMGEELGRAFPGVPLLVVSGGQDTPRHVEASPRIVVATAGSEPTCEGGYAAALVLDARAIAGRPELWAPEEALRRWFTVLALVRPTGRALVVGGVEPALRQALRRWDPVDFAERALDEREALGFFPAATLVALDGPAKDVRAVLDEAEGEVLGILPRPGEMGGNVRGLLRLTRSDAAAGLARLRAIQQTRSARRLTPVGIDVNPPELF